ncbi:aspartyl-tRNA synthetase [Candidatus Protochlamydia naegleriophila]|uniref:Aspartate--tRNA(Asp/Asn) ligase n=2 Tax=Candidatus Protochlamydia naegleriophila TaxID=389348 RepID=A0A0U5JFI1_9BACT|nr:aspartate--tRNA ligase [Candidatus Protochlamydia naegleriophila]CUI17594.1 aspartyl-tRNA synthetase [Candidatus Protochlamydia naegleriophila]
MMFDYRRTHTCGALRKEDINAQVTLSGWVNRRRDHGGLIFIDLRDRFGLTQLVFDPIKSPNAHAAAEKLRSEWVISIKGTVIPRQEGMANPKLPTGDIEILVHEMEILSKAKTPPFSVSDELIDVNEELRLKYRYLDIRRGDVAKKLITRHQAMLAIRKHLDAQGFLEISTPILGKSTPEGARDYLVPSRIYPGLFYALPQSPQIFKQLLMVSGMDRYFQIAQCFRDEDLRADRQPEFTQVDMEMSFGTPEDLMPIIEGLIKVVFKACSNIDVPTPFRRLTHETCMEKYGCDRPDMRFGMELHNLNAIAAKSTFSVFLDQLRVNGIIKGFCVKGGAELSRKAIDEYTDFVGRLGIKGLAWIKRQDTGLSSSIVKFFPEDVQQELIAEMQMEVGDLIFMVADAPARTNQALDHLRRKVARDRGLVDPHHYEFLWVTDFPLFSWNEEEGRLQSEHHPFTSPNLEDIHLFETEPLKMRSSGYDIVLNGYEIGGGSQRIHNSELQQKIFEILKLSPEELETKFGFFLEALSYGTPPHLGIALGLDRLIMILTQTENIRDVIAFPKTQKASDLMMECPSKVATEQLKELEIRVPDAQFSWT